MSKARAAVLAASWMAHSYSGVKKICCLACCCQALSRQLGPQVQQPVSFLVVSPSSNYHVLYVIYFIYLNLGWFFFALKSKFQYISLVSLSSRIFMLRSQFYLFIYLIGVNVLLRFTCNSVCHVTFSFIHLIYAIAYNVHLFFLTSSSYHVTSSFIYLFDLWWFFNALKFKFNNRDLSLWCPLFFIARVVMLHPLFYLFVLFMLMLCSQGQVQ